MTDTEKLKKYEAKEANRKIQVQKYFARRNVKFAAYKAHFEKTANAEQKAALQAELSKI